MKAKQSINKTRLKLAYQREGFSLKYIHYEHVVYFDEPNEDGEYCRRLIPPIRQVSHFYSWRDFKANRTVRYKEYHVVLSQEGDKFCFKVSEPAIDFDKWSNSTWFKRYIDLEDLQSITGIRKELRMIKQQILEDMQSRQQQNAGSVSESTLHLSL